MVAAHPAHSRANPWLRRAVSGDIELVVAAHSLAEAYAVLSTLPTRPRLSAADAWRLLRENVCTRARVVTLTAAEYADTLERMARAGLSGGVIYDALIARVARKAQVNKLVTLKAADFERVWPEGAESITAA